MDVYINSYCISSGIISTTWGKLELNVLKRQGPITQRRSWERRCNIHIF